MSNILLVDAIGAFLDVIKQVDRLPSDVHLTWKLTLPVLWTLPLPINSERGILISLENWLKESFPISVSANGFKQIAFEIELYAKNWLGEDQPSHRPLQDLSERILSILWDFPDEAGFERGALETYIDHLTNWLKEEASKPPPSKNLSIEINPAKETVLQLVIERNPPP